MLKLNLKSISQRDATFPSELLKSQTKKTAEKKSVADEGRQKRVIIIKEYSLNYNLNSLT